MRTHGNKGRVWILVPSSFGDLDLRAICFQVAGKHWKLFSGNLGRNLLVQEIKEAKQKVKLNVKHLTLKEKPIIYYFV